MTTQVGRLLFGAREQLHLCYAMLWCGVLRGAASWGVQGTFRLALASQVKSNVLLSWDSYESNVSENKHYDVSVLRKQICLCVKCHVECLTECLSDI